MLTVYYAHCVAIYSTPQEDRDVALLEDLGFSVINPNSPIINAKCRDIRERWARGEWGSPDSNIPPCLLGYKDDGEAIMELIFKPLAKSNVDLVAFRALPDGRIPAGVAQEIKWAQEVGTPILELPSRLQSRVISVDETREYLREIGQR